MRSWFRVSAGSWRIRSKTGPVWLPSRSCGVQEAADTYVYPHIWHGELHANNRQFALAFRMRLYLVQRPHNPSKVLFILCLANSPRISSTTSTPPPSIRPSRSWHSPPGEKSSRQPPLGSFPFPEPKGRRYEDQRRTSRNPKLENGNPVAMPSSAANAPPPSRSMRTDSHSTNSTTPTSPNTSLLDEHENGVVREITGRQWSNSRARLAIHTMGN